MRIDWWTLVLQAANFLVLVGLLQHFLYRPVQGIITERQQQADRVLVEADDARTAAEELRAKLEAQQAGIDEERHQVLEQAHSAARTETTALLDGARAEANRLLDEQRRQLAQERAEAESDLRLKAIALGVEVARRLLAEARPGGVDRVFLERALDRLSAMPEPQRAALADQLAQGDEVRVMTAAPLDWTARTAFAERLGATLDEAPNVAFAEDPALLAGAEVHFPHMILRHSWRDSLGEIEEDLKRDDRPQGLT